MKKTILIAILAILIIPISNVYAQDITLNLDSYYWYVHTNEQGTHYFKDSRGYTTVKGDEVENDAFFRSIYIKQQGKQSTDKVFVKFDNGQTQEITTFNAYVSLSYQNSKSLQIYLVKNGNNEVYLKVQHFRTYDSTNGGTNITYNLNGTTPSSYGELGNKEEPPQQPDNPPNEPPDETNDPPFEPPDKNECLICQCVLELKPVLYEISNNTDYIFSSLLIQIAQNSDMLESLDMIKNSLSTTNYLLYDLNIYADYITQELTRLNDTADGIENNTREILNQLIPSYVPNIPNVDNYKKSLEENKPIMRMQPHVDNNNYFTDRGNASEQIGLFPKPPEPDDNWNGIYREDEMQKDETLSVDPELKADPELQKTPVLQADEELSKNFEFEKTHIYEKQEIEVEQYQPKKPRWISEKGVFR